MVAGTMDKVTVGSSVSTCIGDERKGKLIQLLYMFNFYLNSL